MAFIRNGGLDGARSRAAFSDCGRHRFILARIWDDQLPTVLFVMLNPSTANECRNDPTVNRCHRLTVRLNGARTGGYEVCNLFSLITPYRQELERAARRSINQENDRFIAEAGRRAGRLICAWGGSGADGFVRRRAIDVVRLMQASFRGPLECLKVNRNGAPAHPLYQPANTIPARWQPEHYLQPAKS